MIRVPLEASFSNMSSSTQKDMDIQDQEDDQENDLEEEDVPEEDDVPEDDDVLEEVVLTEEQQEQKEQEEEEAAQLQLLKKQQAEESGIKKGLVKAQLAADPEFRHGVANTYHEKWPLSSAKPELWKENVNHINCFYDGFPFEGPIYSYPLEYDEYRKVFQVYGVYCSPHCAMRAMIQRKGNNTDLYTLFTLMMHQVYKVKYMVTPASNVDLLRMGVYTLKEWRALPQQNVVAGIQCPEIVPFRMANMKVFSHVIRSHPAHVRLRQWNTTMAETGEILEVEIEPEKYADALQPPKGKLAPLDDHGDMFAGTEITCKQRPLKKKPKVLGVALLTE